MGLRTPTASTLLLLQSPHSHNKEVVAARTTYHSKVGLRKQSTFLKHPKFLNESRLRTGKALSPNANLLPWPSPPKQELPANHHQMLQRPHLQASCFERYCFELYTCPNHLLFLPFQKSTHMQEWLLQRGWYRGLDSTWWTLLRSFGGSQSNRHKFHC